MRTAGGGAVSQTLGLAFRRIEDLYVADSRPRVRRVTEALDIYEAPRAGLAVYEVEFDDPASAAEYQPPPFATREITAESLFSGWAVATARQR